VRKRWSRPRPGGGTKGNHEGKREKKRKKKLNVAGGALSCRSIEVGRRTEGNSCFREKKGGWRGGKSRMGYRGKWINPLSMGKKNILHLRGCTYLGEKGAAEKGEAGVEEIKNQQEIRPRKGGRGRLDILKEADCKA